MQSSADTMLRQAPKASRYAFLESRICFMVGGIALWIALELGYRLFVAPNYAYAGMVLRVDPVKYVEAAAIFILFLARTPKQLGRPSDYFMVLLVFGLLTPMLLFYALADQLRYDLYVVCGGALIIDVLRKGRVIRVPLVKRGGMLAMLIVAGGALLVTAWLVFSGGVSSFNLDLTRVYDFRDDVGDVINVGPMGYLNSWAYKVFGPALLAIGLWKRYYFLVALGVALHIFWFGVSSHKSVLFYPILVFFAWFWFKRTNALSVVPLSMSLVVALTLAIYLFEGYGFAASMFIRRLYFVIASNTFYYYDFFSQNEFIYWSNSLTSAFIKYPYQLDPAALIGASRDTESHVNNTFLSAGYMHAGLAGVLLYCFIVSIVFRFMDSVAAAGVPAWVAVSVLVVPSRALILSSDLPTALLTHGIAIGVLVLLLLRVRKPVTERLRP